MLQELRQLANSYPQDADVRQELAQGLGLALASAMEAKNLQREADLVRELDELSEDQDVLAGMLRVTFTADPQDAGKRHRFVVALVNSLARGETEDELKRQDAQLDELRQLASSWPRDVSVSKAFAGGLIKAATWAKEDGRMERVRDLEDDLASFVKAHAEEFWVGQLVPPYDWQT